MKLIIGQQVVRGQLLCLGVQIVLLVWLKD